jgi:hypothetical protein
MGRIHEWVESIRFDLKQGWKTYVMLVLLFGAIIGLLFWQFAASQLEYSPVKATITNFTTADLDQKYYPGVVVVEARSSDGLIGQGQVDLDEIRGCKVGDEIDAEERGVSLRLKPKPCR